MVRNKEPVVALAQLAVFRTAAVIGRKTLAVIILLLLAIYAQAYAGDSLATRFGDRFVAQLAKLKAFACRQVATRSRYGIFYGAVDLILDRAVICPT